MQKLAGMVVEVSVVTVVAVAVVVVEVVDGHELIDDVPANAIPRTDLQPLESSSQLRETVNSKEDFSTRENVTTRSL